MPSEEIAKTALNLVRQKIETGSQKPSHLAFNAALILRRSLGNHARRRIQEWEK